MEEEVKEIRSFERLGILVLDGSGSMEEPHPNGIKKFEAISGCVKDLILGLKQHPRSPNLFLTILTYDDTVDRNPVVPITPVEEMDDTADYNPMNMNGVVRGGQTAIGDALELAFNVAYDFAKDPNQKYPRSCVILLMTDGINNTGKDPMQVSQEINERIRREELTQRIRRICALGFGVPSDKDSLDADLLRGIVSEEKDENFKITLDSQEIVAFFTKSITAK